VRRVGGRYRRRKGGKEGTNVANAVVDVLHGELASLKNAVDGGTTEDGRSGHLTTSAG
jgi:hypothetical protein